MASYKRRTYIINPKFQFKFCIYVCIIVFLSTVVYPLAMYELFGYFIAYATKNVPTFNPSGLKDLRQGIILVLALWQIGSTAIIFVVCIFFSHKIAGPLYKLSKYLERVRDGGGFETLRFRKGDHFTELADDINKTFESINESYKNDFVYISEVNTYINNLTLVVPDDKKVILTEINKRLAEIQNRFSGI